MPVPFISFILTYHNQELALLHDCIGSITALPLSRSEREVIVIDDGSDTKPESLLNTFGEQVRFHALPCNQGVSAARNQGLSLARGEYIQFVDADDMLHPSVYSSCINLVQTDRPDLLTFGFTRTSTPPRSFKYTPAAKPCSGSAFVRHHNLKGACWGYLFRREIAQGLRFTPGCRYGEDEEFTALLFLRARCMYATNWPAYFYRPNPGSVVHRTDPDSLTRRLDDTRQVITRLAHQATDLDLDRKEAMSRRIAQLTMDYLYNVMRFCGDNCHTESAVEELRKEYLFPLPFTCYTFKYLSFSLLTSCHTGRKALTFILKQQHL